MLYHDMNITTYNIQITCIIQKARCVGRNITASNSYFGKLDPVKVDQLVNSSKSRGFLKLENSE